MINVGIREQLMISVAAGLAQEGLRPIVHSYAPFLVERPFEQIKLDLGHQDVGALLVSIGASYDASAEGRTHQAPGDVALLSTLPGFTIHVPGHPDEVEELLRREFARDGRAYVRLTGETNAEARPVEQVTVVREGRHGDPLVLAVGPTLDPVLEATADLAMTIAYLSTVAPFPAAAVNDLASGSEVGDRRAVPRRHVGRRTRRCTARRAAATARARGAADRAAPLRHAASSIAGPTGSTLRASAVRSTASSPAPPAPPSPDVTAPSSHRRSAWCGP